MWGRIAGIRAGASPDAYAEVFAAIATRRKDVEDRRGGLSAQMRRGGKAEAGMQEGDASGTLRRALADAA